MTATNGNVGTAYATQLTGFTMKQDDGPSCTPTVTAPAAYPLLLGDIPANGTASVTFTVSLVGCNPNSEWVIRVPWNANTYETGTFSFEAEFNRGKGN